MEAIDFDRIRLGSLGREHDLQLFVGKGVQRAAVDSRGQIQQGIGVNGTSDLLGLLDDQRVFRMLGQIGIADRILNDGFRQPGRIDLRLDGRLFFHFVGLIAEKSDHDQSDEDKTDD